MTPIIELKNVSVRYSIGKTNETVALKDISLQIFEGEYIVFFGPSGCGKSTLLYTIAGLESATEGDAHVAGEDLREIQKDDLIHFYRNTIGMVFQAFYLVPHLSAKDNMMLSKMFSGASVAEREQKADALMEKFGITSYSDRKPSMMSGGQQQRTAIARALMNDPKIILADEPVGNLDSKNAEIVLELLAQIHRDEKKTVIQVTHNPKDIHYADRVFYMKDGAIERVVANTDKGSAVAAPAGQLSELEKLSLANPDLSDSRLHARLIMRRVLLLYDIDTEQRVETIIEKYIKKEVSKENMIRFLDDPKEGAGVYKQKAHRLADQIEDIVKEIASILTTKETASPASLLERNAQIIRRHLLDRYDGHITPETIRKLDRVIAARISGEISAAELKEALDVSEQRGGLGLNRKTAKRFAEEVEFVLSQK